MAKIYTISDIEVTDIENVRRFRAGSKSYELTRRGDVIDVVCHRFAEGGYLAIDSRMVGRVRNLKDVEILDGDHYFRSAIEDLVKRGLFLGMGDVGPDRV